MRHQKRLHQETTTSASQHGRHEEQDEVTTCSVDEGNDQKWLKDPGDLIYENELEAGRIIRKKTSPALPGIKRRTE
jgi:hypothetical protein